MDNNYEIISNIPLNLKVNAYKLSHIELFLKINLLSLDEGIMKLIDIGLSKYIDDKYQNKLDVYDIDGEIK